LKNPENRKYIKSRKSPTCDECGGLYVYDVKRDELVCTQCGLTNRTDKPITELSYDLHPYKPEQDEIGDDDENTQGIIEGREDGRVKDFVTSHEPMRVDKPYTHYNFIRTTFRRCLGTYGYPVKCAPNSRGQYEQCEGCPHAIETSLRDREAGDPSLPPEIRYPVQFAATFSKLPKFTHDLITSAERKSHYDNVQKHYPHKIIVPRGSAPTIKKELSKPNSGWVKISDRYFMTKEDYDLMKGDHHIPDLMMNHPKEGWHAVMALWAYSGNMPTYKELEHHLSDCCHRWKDTPGKAPGRSDWLELLIKYEVIRPYRCLTTGNYYFRNLAPWCVLLRNCKKE
jgi:hypothetical protein